MNVQGITKMSVRAFALAVLEAAGLRKREYGDNGARLKYLCLESPDGSLVVRFGNVSSIRLVKRDGQSMDRNLFDVFKINKEEIVHQERLDKFVQFWKRIGVKNVEN